MEKYFTTSKGVHIGRLWVNRCQPTPIVDRDMLLIQEALTQTPLERKRRRENFIRYWEVAFGLAALVALFISYRPEPLSDSRHESIYKKEPPAKYINDPKYWWMKINKHHKEVTNGS